MNGEQIRMTLFSADDLSSLVAEYLDATFGLTVTTDENGEYLEIEYPKAFNAVAKRIVEKDFQHASKIFENTFGRLSKTD
jgi:hypothetical protein